ncbi:hypothetical protein R3P38DRAFT_3466411 [Favolaschia claudopus]|uniref:Uncharacterized protein n=1 Tax=Favolaschia claudopus TaxID=2862362 RepID=A0AAV9ZF03_9AGAR
MTSTLILIVKTALAPAPHGRLSTRQHAQRLSVNPQAIQTFHNHPRYNAARFLAIVYGCWNNPYYMCLIFGAGLSDPPYYIEEINHSRSIGTDAGFLSTVLTVYPLRMAEWWSDGTQETPLQRSHPGTLNPLPISKTSRVPNPSQCSSSRVMRAAAQAQDSLSVRVFLPVTRAWNDLGLFALGCQMGGILPSRAEFAVARGIAGCPCVRAHADRMAQ